MMNLDTYNPCETCKPKINFGRCPMGQRRMCFKFALADILKYDREHKIDFPDELLIEAIRNRGWHGELRQQTVVKI